MMAIFLNAAKEISTLLGVVVRLKMMICLWLLLLASLKSPGPMMKPQMMAQIKAKGSAINNTKPSSSRSPKKSENSANVVSAAPLAIAAVLFNLL